MKTQLISICILVIMTFQLNAQNPIWDYPIKPKTKEWKKLESNKEKVGVCQIPENVLLNISTKELMTTCLQYPLLYDIFAFNNTNDGLRKLFSDFNGIREFSKREEAINMLQEQYLAEIRNFHDKIHQSSNLDIGHSIVQISTLEVLLSYFEFHKQISKETHKKILGDLLFGYKEKCKYYEYFKGNGFATNLFARAHIILQIDTELSMLFDKNNQSVLFSGMANADLINVIDEVSYSLIKQ